VLEGSVQTIDHAAELEHLQAAQQKMLVQVPERDWAGRTVDELAPMMLETVESLA